MQPILLQRVLQRNLILLKIQLQRRTSKLMRYDAVMGLGFSTMKLIIHESVFGLSVGNLQGALIGFTSVLAAISVLCKP